MIIASLSFHMVHFSSVLQGGNVIVKKAVVEYEVFDLSFELAYIIYGSY